ncbi:unnamed protein product [Dibothriocephalus latus]|uniref:Uncharacterized protein n=1 Tax=Dibothriocephalus latus TaxID=60516 RepID=A0A3P6RXR6_DIBLA|nr:unnamed protein product [Dibothriocephalus latus]
MVCAGGRDNSSRRPPPAAVPESRGEEEDEEIEVASMGEKHCRLEGEVVLQQEGLELLKAGGERFKQSEVLRDK